MATKGACQHTELLLECSPWAEEAGFELPEAAKRFAAATKAGRNPLATTGESVKAIEKLSREAAARLALSFLGRLLLLKDALNWEPNCPAQSFRSAVVEYLSAFYHGHPVKSFPHELCFVPWIGTSRGTKSADNHTSASLASTKATSNRAHIGLAPDERFKRQSELGRYPPSGHRDAPGRCVHDRHDDDFCCGGALGASSRVCVVSSTRYSPALDEESIDHQHMWPTSRRNKFTNRLCTSENLEPQKHIKSVYETPESPLRRVVQAAKTVPTSPTVKALNGLWFPRVARTLVREVGHCFAISHSLYYACNMQGTSYIAEDLRQPPYVCPICLEKVTYAIGCELQQHDKASKGVYVKERYRAIARFCEAWKHVGLFVGYGARVQARLQQLTS
ncbi:hypothetical protein F5Y03DRAFT_384963 [Xylaria venustula]|nr:hypothetical protein F5Y03DRAFT_384963 [Xylaria venustula]